MSPFLKAQDSGWYPKFLNPVVEAILADSTHTQILDIGTGPGKLTELLIERNPNLHITGIDINLSMIEEARKRVTHKNVSFQHQTINAPLAFQNNSFDVVTFCSVLFLLDDATKSFLMDEALWVLKPKGKLLVLSPTGLKSTLCSISEMKSFTPSENNWTFLVWKTLTSSRGRKWQQEKWLSGYSETKALKYTVSLAFNNHVSIESISK